MFFCTASSLQHLLERVSMPIGRTRKGHLSTATCLPEFADNSKRKVRLEWKTRITTGGVKHTFAMRTKNRALKTMRS